MIWLWKYYKHKSPLFKDQFHILMHKSGKSLGLSGETIEPPIKELWGGYFSIDGHGSEDVIKSVTPFPEAIHEMAETVTHDSPEILVE